jgi:ribose/xylose/arabinose/galactoside ABC-type transport system permease subunit
MSINTLRRLILILLLVVLGAAISIANPAFLTRENLMTLLQEAALYGIVALGMTFVLITAEIDISIGAVIAFTSMICVNFLVYTQIPVAFFVPVAIAVGALVGVVNGFFITYFKLPDFIVTLATRGILSGLALVIAVKEGGFVSNVYIQNPAYLWFGGELGPTHVVTVAFFLLAIVAHFLLKHTRFGTNVYATGANLNAARLSGVNTNRTIIGVYALTGMCASIAAIFISSRMMTAMPELGIGQEMDVIASVVIGGTAFSGGIGDIPGTVLGVLFLALIKNGILKLGISPFVQPVVIGGLIVVTVIVDTWYRRLAERMISQAALRRRAAAYADSTAKA